MSQSTEHVLASICFAAVLQLGCGADPASTGEPGSGAKPSGDSVGEVLQRLTIIESSTKKGHTMQLRQCAVEGDACVIGSPKLAAFGVPGNLAFNTLATTQDCTRSHFNNANPASGQARACYYAPYTPLIFNGRTIVEGNNATAIGTIAYGANGVFNFLTLTTMMTFSCINEVFATPDLEDPAPGVQKACYRLADYEFAAIQRVNISTFFTPVAYGANGHFNYQVLSGNVRCDDSVFGDPISGVKKACYFLPFPLVAFEGNNFSFSGTGRVDYGSGANGVWLTADAQSGPCTNGFFFADPDVGVTKACYGRVVP